MYKVGEEYFHIKNMHIVTIIDPTVLPENELHPERVRVSSKHGTYFAWTSLLRPITKLEKVLK